MRYALGPLLPALVLAFVVGCAMPMFERPKVVHPPPKGWEQLGLHPAWTERTFDDLGALWAFCREHGGLEAPKRAGQAYTMACAAEGPRVVALPSGKAWPNKGEIAALKPHEYAHTWGLTHSGAKSDSWVFRDGSAAFPLSDQQIRMMRGMAEKAHGPSALQQLGMAEQAHSRASR